MSNTISKQNQDPNVYAQQYANQNGMTLDAAKTQLKTQFGDPQQNQNSLFDGMSIGNQNSDSKKSSFNDPEFAVDSDFSLKGMFQNLVNKFQGNSKNSTNGSNSNKPDPSMDPNTYAQQYANEKGLTLDEAKAELQSKYGDPQKPDDANDKGYVNASSTANSATSGTTSSDKPDPSVDPDTYAQQYANEKGLTLDEAKAELQSKYGDPQKPDASNNNSAKNANSKANSTSNMPDPSVDPDTYAQQYANENGLTLDQAKAELQSKYGAPQKPDNADGSSKTSENADSTANKPDQNIDPNTYVEQYANENGLTVEAAKAELESIFGAPEKPKKGLFS